MSATSPAARPRLRLRASRAGLLALAGLLLGGLGGLGPAGAARAGAEELLPPSPKVDRPLYQANRVGMEHFTQDQLHKLIAGQRWEWMGHTYEAVRLHRIHRCWVTRAKQASRDFSSPARGWCVATLHVKVDGRLMAARVEANASYVWQPGGFGWESVLLYLGNGDSYDFASRSIR